MIRIALSRDQSRSAHRHANSEKIKRYVYCQWATSIFHFNFNTNCGFSVLYLILFWNTTQIVQLLKPNQSLTHCPRCNGYSIVHPAVATADPSHSPTKTRRQQRSITMTKPTQNKKLTHNNEYADCPKCPFQFCTKCLKEPHSSALCPQSPGDVSPTSDEEIERMRKKPQNSRRNLQRLARMKWRVEWHHTQCSQHSLYIKWMMNDLNSYK